MDPLIPVPPILDEVEVKQLRELLETQRLMERVGYSAEHRAHIKPPEFESPCERLQRWLDDGGAR